MITINEYDKARIGKPVYCYDTEKNTIVEIEKAGTLFARDCGGNLGIYDLLRNVFYPIERCFLRLRECKAYAKHWGK